MSQPAPNRPRARRIVRLLLWLGVVLLLVSSPALWFRWANTLPPYEPPAVMLPEPNGYTLALEALGGLNTAAMAGDAWWDWEPEALRQGVTANRTVLAELRPLLALEWRVPVNWEDDPDQAISAAIDAGVAFMNASSLLRAESEVAAVEGDYGHSLTAALDLLALGSLTAPGAGVSELLRAMLPHGYGRHRVEALLALAPTPALREALPRLSRIRGRWPTPMDVLEHEREEDLRWARWTFADINDRGFFGWLRAAFRHGRDDGLLPVRDDNPSAPDWSALPAVLALGMANKRALLENIDVHWEAVMAESRKPPAEQQVVLRPRDAYKRYVLAQWSEADRPDEEEYDDLPLRALRRSLYSVHTSLARLETLLAAELFRREHGRYPASLEEIPREWLPEVPLDGNGDPVTYRLEDGEPVVEGWLPAEPGGER